MSYSDFANQVSSEKLILAILHASKRLMGWTLHSGSIYKLTGFDVPSIVSIEDSGSAYTEVSSITSVTASKFYNDRENQTLYLRTTGSDNPNSRFLVLTKKLFFSNSPIALPHDLSTGHSVYFEPLIQSTSVFGVEIDTVNQTSEAIEGSGTLALFNDQTFWQSNFDKLSFENRDCYIYSFNRDLDVTEAKLLFHGTVERRTYSPTKIQFTLKDSLVALNSPVALTSLDALSERTSLVDASQRMVLGHVYGHRLVNLDEVLDGFPGTGTVSVDYNSQTVTGSGTQFLTELSPNDQLILDGTEYSVATITSNTSLTLSSTFTNALNLTAAPLLIKPDKPKRYMNRRWLVAGHAVRQPTTTIRTNSTILRLDVDSTEDIRADDFIYIGSVGSGELVQVDRVISSTRLTLKTSLTTNPTAGTTLFKPALQNVRIDNLGLVFERDYTFDPDTAIMVLTDTAEANASPVYEMPQNITFTNASRTVTGIGFKDLIAQGTMVSSVGHADYFEVLSVDSDTQLTLRSAATFSSSGTKGKYKNFILDPNNSIVTCDLLGRTDDGTSTGALLRTAPEIIRAMLIDLGLEDRINEASFTEADEICPQTIGLVVPEKFDATDRPTYREIFNAINKSVFGSLVQTQSFELSYLVLQPLKTSAALRLDEADILDFSVESQSDKIVKTAKVIYRKMEIDPETKEESYSTQQKTSEVSTYLIQTDKERVIESALAEEDDAERFANRWAFILENATTTIKVKTKLQAINLEVGSIVDITHQKLYERLGSTSKRKLALVESVKKSAFGVELSMVDLSNAFNRVACFTNITTDWADTDEEGRIYGGFITDQYGLIDNDPDSFGTNLIW
jgi:hypothetical protein